MPCLSVCAGNNDRQKVFVMDCYLELIAKTPLDFLYSEYFPGGFPAKKLATGWPERFKRSCGATFWKLDIELMDQLQRRAILNYYHYSIRTQRTDWTPLLKMASPELLQDTGLEKTLTSVLSAEPPNAAIVFVESAPAIADYCISQDFWELWLTQYTVRHLQGQMALLQAKKQRRLVVAYQQPAVQMPPDIRQREPQPVAPTAPTTLQDWHGFNHFPPGF